MEEAIRTDIMEAHSHKKAKLDKKKKPSQGAAVQVRPGGAGHVASCQGVRGLLRPSYMEPCLRFLVAVQSGWSLIQRDRKLRTGGVRGPPRC